jgi:hypothetical protein
MERAIECLAEADLLAVNGHYNACVNRLYYACFYAVNALLILNGYSSAKHSGIRSLFNQHFVKLNKIPKELAVVYNDLFESRQESDYEDFVSVEEHIAVGFMEPAKRFVKFIEKHLNCR